jgi:hypothetical protein
MCINWLFPKNNWLDRHYAFFANYGNTFEDCGNYVYAVSRREIEKVVQGMNLQAMAWTGLNDHYVKGGEFEKADPGNPLFQELRQAIQKKDDKCRKYPLFHDYGLQVIVLFKDAVDQTLRGELAAHGFSFAKTCRNPHV